MSGHSSDMATSPGSLKYFFGRITRDESESYLKEAGLEDGMFLLRESMKKMDDYVLSLCFRGSVYHYSMVRRGDGQLQIDNGKKFPGPAELILYHQQQRGSGGMVTHPVKPCNRHSGQSYAVFRGLTSDELDKILIEKAMKLKSPIQDALTVNRLFLINMVKMNLHKQLPWYHGTITREEAEAAMKASRLMDGKYLLRAQANVSAEPNEYRLTLCHREAIKHYLVGKKKQKLFINGGPGFESLVELVDFYHNKADGLLCALTTPCHRARVSLPASSVATIQNPAYGTATELVALPTTNNSLGPVLRAAQSSLLSPLACNVASPKSPGQQFFESSPDIHPDSNIYEDPETYAGHTYAEPSTLSTVPDAQLRQKAEENQKIYDSLPTKAVVMNLPLDALNLQESLGAGNFGSVVKGIYKESEREIPVAVKTLKDKDIASCRAELMKEAQVMVQLVHKHIVRIIGVVQGDNLLLVLELAELGSMKMFLRNQRDFPMKKIAMLMYQVALGMQFLESQKFVHRDLATRNVLLASDTFAKISDFGLSKAIDANSQYYKATQFGTWPVQWYAPECINYRKFTPKSDVWSFGITLWEATSYGRQPFRKVMLADLSNYLQSGQRLRKPSKCPDELYEIITKCWQYNENDRPTFVDVVKLMRTCTEDAQPS